MNHPEEPMRSATRSDANSEFAEPSWWHVIVLLIAVLGLVGAITYFLN